VRSFKGTTNWLVVWNMAFMTFHILGIVIPTDELIFFRGVKLETLSCMANWGGSESKNR